MNDEQRNRLKAAIEVLKQQEGTEETYRAIGQMVMQLTKDRNGKLTFDEARELGAVLTEISEGR